MSNVHDLFDKLESEVNPDAAKTRAGRRGRKGALDEERYTAADIEVPAALKDLVINVEISGTPDGDVHARMAGGQFLQGAADDAPTKLKIPYDVARKMIVEGDQSAAMQAFMSGQIQVEGDIYSLTACNDTG